MNKNVTGPSSRFETLVELLRWRAEEQANQVACIFVENGGGRQTSVTYSELDLRARAIAALLQRSSRPGDRVMLLYPPGIEYVAAFFGCLYAGCIAVPSYPPRPNRDDPRLRAIALDSAASVSMTDQRILEAIAQRMPEAARAQGPLWLATDPPERDQPSESQPSERSQATPAATGATPDMAQSWRDPGSGRDTLAFLQYTSGSTAAPKGVMLTHGNLLENLDVINECFGLGPQDKVVSWLPPYHDMGLIGGILQPIFGGLPVVLMSPVTFLQSPFRWLQTISEHRATTSGGPNFAYDLCVAKTTPEQRATLDLSTWEVAFNGAEPIRPATLKRFTKVFAPQGFRAEAFYPCYGLAEASLFVSGSRKHEPPVFTSLAVDALAADQIAPAEPRAPGSRMLVGCGRQSEQLPLAIVEPQTCTPCPADRVGEIWVRGASIAQGYWRKPEATAETFQARLAGSGDGPFLRTGDLGFMHEGQLHVTGRLKDLIIIRGRNHYPQDIEMTAETSHRALRPGCCAAFELGCADAAGADAVGADAVGAGDGAEQLVIVQEVAREHRNGDLAGAADAIRQAVAEAHELRTDVVVLIRTGTIPKTSSGKIQRRRCRAMLLDGGLQELYRDVLDADPAEGAASGADTDDAIQAEVLLESLLDALGRAADAGGGTSWEASVPAEHVEALGRLLRAEAARVMRLERSRLDPELSLTTLGLDSMQAIELSHTLTSLLGVQVELVDLLEGVSLVELTRNVLDQLRQQAGGTAERAASGSSAASAAPVEVAPGRLTRGQRALWFLQRLAPDSAAYNIARAARIEGELDVEALRRAFQALSERHPVLRAVLVAPEGEPQLEVAESVELELEPLDMSAADDQEVRRLLADEAWRPFDLEHGPLLRVRLVKHGPSGHLLLLAIHHVVADFWSLAVLLRELGALYAAERRQPGAGQGLLEPLPVGYSDYVGRQIELSDGDEGERLWSYWSRRLAGDLPVLDLPTIEPRPSVQTSSGASRSLELDGRLLGALRQLGQAHGCTLNMTLLAAFQVLLHRFSGQRDILVGCPVAHRVRPEHAGLVGYLINPMVMRADLSGDPAVASLLEQVRATVLGAFEHQGYPFDLLVERLQPSRDLSRSPIFQAMFAFLQVPFDDAHQLAPFALNQEGGRLDLGGLELRSVSLEHRASQVDLALTVAETGDRLGCFLEYNSDLFTVDTIERLLAGFETLLRGMVEPTTAAEAADVLESAASSAAARRISELPVLRERDRRLQLETWNATAVEYDRAAGLPDLLAARCRQMPNAPAVIFGEIEGDGTGPAGADSREPRLTYAELETRSNQLARYLRLQGAGRGSLVGICVERCLDTVVAMWGVLKSGAGYVPLDPGHPASRIAYSLDDAGVEIVITQERLLERIEGVCGSRLCIDRDWPAIEGCDAGPLECRPGGDDVAYVIYTSGSTGRPKGVAIRHRNVVNFLRAMQQRPGLDRGDVLLAVTTVSFDIAGLELFLPLISGATVVLASRRQAADGRLLSGLIERHGVTAMQATPATWRLLLDSGWKGRVGLKVLAGGDTLPRRLADELVEVAGSVWNMYGPTETTIWSLVHRVDAGQGQVSIGRPIDNTWLAVLDEALNPVPIGVVGELYLGGDGVAIGYTGRPRLTAERFVPDSIGREPGARLYRTGDLVRYRPDGCLEFLGRTDHQVKIRGFRIELDEIQAVLEQHPEIDACVVVATGSRLDERRLVAYLVPVEGSAGPAITELRAFLATQLPEYMIPAAFMVLPALPLTPNGKVDRKALPEVDAGRPQLGAELVAPQTGLERRIAEVWQDVLGIERVGINDGFFELGGHSLLMAKIHSRLRDEGLAAEISMVELFQYPTVHALATYLGSREQAVPEGARVEVRTNRASELKRQRDRRRSLRSER